MKIQSTRLVQSVGDASQLKQLLRQSGDRIEASEIDPDSGVTALAKLDSVASLVEAETERPERFAVFLDIANTPEGTLATAALLQGIGASAMRAPATGGGAEATGAGVISISPTVGGMGLGLMGGVGLGLAIEALRTTANATGNPVASSLVLGLGLVGTAVGGLAGSGGSISLKLPGVELSVKSGSG